MPKKITILNTFHHTEMDILIPDNLALRDHLAHLEIARDDPYNYPRSSKRAKNKLKRIKNTLCGNNDCKCQPFIVQKSNITS